MGDTARQYALALSHDEAVIDDLVHVWPKVLDLPLVVVFIVEVFEGLQNLSATHESQQVTVLINDGQVACRDEQRPTTA